MLLLSNFGTRTTNKTSVTTPFQVLHLGVPTPNCVCVVVLCTSHTPFSSTFGAPVTEDMSSLFSCLFIIRYFYVHTIISSVFLAQFFCCFIFFSAWQAIPVFSQYKDTRPCVQVLAAWLISTPVAALLPLFFLCSSSTSLSLWHIIPPSSVSYILLFPVLARNDPPDFTDSLLSLSLLCGLSCQMFRTHLWPWPEVAPGCQGGM